MDKKERRGIYGKEGWSLSNLARDACNWASGPNRVATAPGQRSARGVFPSNRHQPKHPRAEPIKTVAPTPIIDRAHLLKLPLTTNSGPRVVSSLADDVPAGPNMPLPTAHEGRAREGAGFALRAGLSTREVQVRHWAHVGSNHVGRAPPLRGPHR